MDKPVILLDIDGVVNAISRPPGPSNVWPEDKWVTGEATADGTVWPILAATPVVSYLRDVHEKGLAEIRWHTTWQGDAWNVSDLLGLPRFPIADAPEFYDQPRHAAQAIRDGKPPWWKLPTALRVLEARRPLLWIDDDIPWELRNNFDVVGPDGGSFLMVYPATRHGLTAGHLLEIDQFLRRWQ